MSFLNPAALLALAAITVPLFLHFFNLRQPQTVEFSSLAFVKELQKSTVQRVRIKEWLLLVLRMLAIASLVLAFSQPTLTGRLAGVGTSVPTTHVLVVDNSLSMRAEGKGGTYFTQAIENARRILDTVQEEDDVLVWPTLQTGPTRSKEILSADIARQQLDELEPISGAASLSRSIVQAATAASESNAPRTEVYVVSDLQSTSLGDSVSERVPGNVSVQVIPVETRPQSNVGITDVSVTSRIAEVGQPVGLEATLVNYAASTLDNYVASVYLEGERVAQATATLEPGLETTVAFTITPQTRGWLAGAVATEDDDFSPDDRHHFTLHVPEERRILLVRGDGQKSRYLDLALSTEMVEDRIAFQTSSIDETELASTELGQYDTVLLEGPRSLSSGEVEALTRYVDRGGGLLLFPSAQARPEDYNALLGAMNAGTFRGFSGSLSGGQTVTSFERVDLQHPLFEGVFSEDRRREEASVEQPELYHVMNFRPSGRTGQTLIELSNGFPFLHEVRHGSGVLLLMAVAPTRKWSDLPVRGLFVPLLYRSVYYLSASTSVAGEQLVVGKSNELRIAGVAPEASLQLRGPDGLEVTPDQRILFGATLMQVGSTLTDPGVYDVVAGTTRVRRVAVNVDPSESDLRVATTEEAVEQLQKTIGTTVRSVVAGAQEDLVETLRTRKSGTEIWNVFLLLALIFLLIEMGVARHWRPETVSS